MQLLDYIQVKTDKGFADIELYLGDLSAIPKEHKVDIVILSAFPNNYAPTPNTLIGSLDQKGLSVAKLANDKDMDLRKTLWCWFSKELSRDQVDKFNFSRILCFEPEKRRDDAAEYVADIFRCLNNFVFDDDVNHVAMPAVAAGNQRASIIKITEAIIEAATFWLQRGLPLQSLKLVEINEQKAEDLRKVFTNYKAQESFDTSTGAIDDIEVDRVISSTMRSVDTGPLPLAPKPPSTRTATATTTELAPIATPTPVATDQFDVFISYAHKNKDHVRYFIETLRQKNPSLRIFYDSDSIPKGGQWLKEISRCIDKSKKVIVFLSKEFDESPACWDEFQCAKVRQNRTGKNIIMNIYLLDHPELPTMFEIFNWIDCREADKQKLESAIADVVNSLEN
jgi:hypothetical protein